MDENLKNSTKLDIQEAEANSDSSETKEIYKPIPEDDNAIVDKSKSESKMVQNDETVNDGADEKMLGANEDKNLLAAKKDEVKFISGDQQNGDAKIDIGVLNKAEETSFTGMSKDELMKYANDPFWVRLRWTFFVLFWAIWVGMLIGAIMIIINAPKCAAPTALVWWKQGPLIKYNNINDVTQKDVEQTKKLYGKGVIYELPPEDTYLVKTANVEQRIKRCIDNYKDTDINIILDMTPNYVTKDSELFTDALNDKTKRSSFIWRESAAVPNNWLSIENGSAWHKVNSNNYILSQFGDDKYDLNMNDTIVKKKLIDVFEHLIKMGINGFRLTNTKYFLVSSDLKDEVISTNKNFVLTDYGFWTHSATKFQEGLGDLLQEYKLAVRNISNYVFLSVTEDLIRPEVFQIKSGDFGVDLPIYGRLTHSFNDNQTEKFIYNELRKTFDKVANNSWIQWNYDLEHIGHLDISAYNIFLILLPGVPIIQGNSSILNNVTTIGALENLRNSASFMHGNFDLYHSGNVVAYSRIKSGNPGFLVILNPTANFTTGNFSAVGLPEKMTIEVLSDNYNVTDFDLKGKVMSDTIPISPYSAAILTYVPVKSG